MTTTAPRALVTGASAGIGAAFARRLATRGYRLTLVARDRARLDALATELGGAEVLAADLGDPEARRLVEAHLANTPAYDLVINNAGFGTVGAFASLDIEREEQEVQVNVLALMRLTRAALPAMVRAGRGGIINVSSIAGFNPGPRNATYCATKAFVTSFTESLSEELRGTGVTVQALCPGFTQTEFQARAQIDTSGVPSVAWMTAEAVVDESLAALAQGAVVCVPGFKNRALVMAMGVVPRSALRRLASVLTRSF
jgi:uncharacterized protein